MEEVMESSPPQERDPVSGDSAMSSSEPATPVTESPPPPPPPPPATDAPDTPPDRDHGDQRPVFVRSQSCAAASSKGKDKGWKMLYFKKSKRELYTSLLWFC